jgi:GH15 family glucan-1,4-alpha-glucosidase
MAAVAARHRPGVVAEFQSAAQRIHQDILTKAWNPQLGSFVARPGSDELDAALLQLVSLRFLPMNDARLRDTVSAISRGLGQQGWLLRYRIDDGFGQPQVAFIICMFWLVEALARLGQRTEAEAVMQKAREALSPLGLLAEDYHTSEKRLWGNFPQAYSHVGLIHAAFAASPSWDEVL